KRLAELLRDRLGKKVLIGLQDPIRLDKFSEPQPDISVLIRRDDFYSGSHPTARDVYLLIEVAETSVEFDRTIKLDLYAQANIPEVWLIDLQNEAIEAYRDPRNKQYQGKDQLKRGQSLSSNALPELKLAVDDIFGAI
ncbi:MAG: Uma2 family endonuclease, partial [Aliifodinibius sp.]|nr:Uma2 family endonuclease [Fodinibius sp.]NIV15506.1 Uma2 family endonuclease [Fodinibius sp.]NIY29352.1 Uma2 family endonuclease [Fodinibius sp.]